MGAALDAHFCDPVDELSPHPLLIDVASFRSQSSISLATVASAAATLSQAFTALDIASGFGIWNLFVGHGVDSRPIRAKSGTLPSAAPVPSRSGLARSGVSIIHV